MSGPSRKDVDAMANILKALQGDTSGVKAEASQSAQVMGGEVDLTPGVSSADVKAMENILKSFHSVSSNVAKKVATTITETKKIHNGVEIGFYTVEKTADELHNIRDNRTGDTLFEDIRLYETAFLITKSLNEGKKVNSPEITKVMASNAIFEQYYYDALQHRHTFNSAKKRGDFDKMDIAEARFARAKSEASQAKVAIKKLYESAR
jgi:hypothetical protein